MAWKFTVYKVNIENFVNFSIVELEMFLIILKISIIPEEKPQEVNI